jgi:hypothetical protein
MSVLEGFLLLLAPVFSCANPLGAQVRMPVDALGPYVLERTVTDRWIHGSRHPGFVPFDVVTDGIDLQIRIARAGTPWRLMRLDLRGTRADLDLEPDNRVRFLTLDLPPRYVRPSDGEGTSPTGLPAGHPGGRGPSTRPQGGSPPGPQAPGLPERHVLATAGGRRVPPPPAPAGGGPLRSVGLEVDRPPGPGSGGGPSGPCPGGDPPSHGHG